jgi:hypothetical protein
MGCELSGGHLTLGDSDASVPPVHRQVSQIRSRQRRQRLPRDGAGPSTVPPASDPLAVMGLTLNRLEKQVHKLMRQNQWLIQSLVDVADVLSVELSYDLEDESSDD